MAYHTILVHVDLGPQAPDRIGLAAAIAKAHGAHLIGAAMTGISRFVYPQGDAGLAQVLDGYVETIHQHTSAALARFEAIAQAHGLVSYETRLIGDDPEGGLLQLSPFCDLLVLGQDDPAHPAPGALHGVPEYVMLNCARPVLVVPYAGNHPQLDGRALVAWNGSLEATRAVTGAIPLLQGCAPVSVVRLEPAAHTAPAPGGFDDLAAWLARHHVNVETALHHTGLDAGEALLTLAADMGAGLIVMGGYGHSRFHELVLGGATRTVLRSATVPVLMAH
jgi:nucleotide-binding universal stress UspA family protein